MDSHITLTKQLIELQANHRSSSAVIEHLFEKLHTHQYVKESFLEAVLKREEIYPTGLPLSKMGVAIPHTDSEHVLKPAIAVSVLQNPVVFNMMGSPDTQISVDIVLMLAISDPKKQLAMLQRLMNVFQDEQAMEAIKNAEAEEKIVELLNNKLQLIEIK
ncbi:PTS sugar transporter subunit IIA [Domibacillus sp. DTU_2020_1001157_1_SI_ALB_TIR_016]|uniref:PTS sugar transporter subunit IIA n=1 Tax=Domibacillus sp. DTU_2020_1001157_1_SI_ALB_TIR_016 TaxID=3077789 RepID=UPI0028EFE954|nr:PTS sugar transporter subunit IIA [Domibacillus sp. DTU_2020_1001157_1_SI_ALB_TIR_016]WNS81027.1 PTS sugar transporter subunit IIA [Domibacillus sp. DTU_2020_1001157_1_SI_ALB_TIR_016]